MEIDEARTWGRQPASDEYLELAGRGQAQQQSLTVQPT